MARSVAWLEGGRSNRASASLSRCSCAIFFVLLLHDNNELNSQMQMECMTERPVFGEGGNLLKLVRLNLRPVANLEG